jgi:hypothetical protein
MKTNPEAIEKVIRDMVEIGEADQGGMYFEIVHAVALIFPSELKEQLTQLVKGPVWDGDVISKSHRGRLFAMGLAIRVCCKGEQGYTGARYIAYSILKKINQIAESKTEQVSASDPRSIPVDANTIA